MDEVAPTVASVPADSTTGEWAMVRGDVTHGNGVRAKSSGGSSGSGRPRVLFINRSYWPDAEATGQLLTELCEDLATSFDVTVVAGHPNQNPDASPYRRAGCDWRAGVSIRRVPHLRWPKSTFLARLSNHISFLCSAALAALAAPRPALLVVQTDPPLLCPLGALLAPWLRSRLVLYLQDIYPDVAVALGQLREGWLTRRLAELFRWSYRRADRVLVLSQDMRSAIVKAGVDPGRVRVVPNWTDTRAIYPVKEDNPFRKRHALNGHFVVMYSGNLGLAQRLESLLLAAERLRHDPQFVFLFIGDGVRRGQLEEMARRLRLGNVRFLPYQPRTELAQSLSAADLHVVPLGDRVVSCLMPSKLYGILASATPLLAAAPESSELARLVRGAGLGLVVPPDDPQAAAQAIDWGRDHADQLRVMGHNARQVAIHEFDRQSATTRLEHLFREVLEGPRR